MTPSRWADPVDDTDETAFDRGSVGSVDRIPRRLIVTLQAYVAEGSHKGAAWRLGISESTSRQRVSQLMRLAGARTAAEAVWLLREELGR
jgi:DNA-binding NarL/FixJ family response regulator